MFDQAERSKARTRAISTNPIDETITAETTRVDKRSAVRRVVTYLLLITYVACAIALIVIFVTKGLIVSDVEKAGLYLQTALAIFAGVSAATLSVIGYWFGNRNIAADSKLMQEQLAAGFKNQEREGTEFPTSDHNRTESTVPIYPVGKDKLEAAYRRALQAYKDRPGVTGIDKGYKYINGNRTNEVVLRIHVREKINVDKLTSDQFLPRQFHGVPVDIIEGEGQSSASEGVPPWEGPVSPLQPGLRIRNAADVNTYGTLGLIVYGLPDTNGNYETYILSCAHVLVSANDSTAEDILQPGPDNGQDQIISSLDRWKFDHRLDAALARLNDSRQLDRRIYGTQTELKSARMPVVGETLRKIGSETGITEATVEGIGSYRVSHHLGNQLIEGFQLRPKGAQADFNISEGGDSGSIWYDPISNSAVGLHYMGNAGFAPDAAYACFMPLVLREFNITLRPT